MNHVQVFNRSGIRSAEGILSHVETFSDGVLVRGDFQLVNSGYLALLLGATAQQLLSGLFTQEGDPLIPKQYADRTVFRFRLEPHTIFCPETWMRDTHVFFHQADNPQNPANLLKRFP